MSIEEIDKGQIEAALRRANRPVAVDLWMEDCPPCNMMEPKLETVSAEYADTVSTYRVKVDMDDPLLDAYDVEAMPTVLFVRDGEVVGRAEGLIQADELREAFANLTDAF